MFTYTAPKPVGLSVRFSGTDFPSSIGYLNSQVGHTSKIGCFSQSLIIPNYSSLLMEINNGLIILTTVGARDSRILIGKHRKVVTVFVLSVLRTLQAQHNSIPIKAIRASISDDWSSTGFMEAAAELESTGTGHGGVDREKLKEKRDKERQKERAKVEKEKENEDGEYNASTLENSLCSLFVRCKYRTPNRLC